MSDPAQQPSAFPSSWGASNLPSGSTTSPPPSRPRRPLGLLLALVVLVVALAAAGTVAVVQTTRLDEAEEQVAELRAQAEADDARIAELEQQLQDRPAGGLEDLLGGSGLEDLLDGSGLEDLLGGGGMEDLLGPDGPLGGLEDLLGEGVPGDGTGIAAPDVTPCLEDVADLPDIGEGPLPQQFGQVAAAVEDLRGQDFPDDISPEILSGQEIRDFFAAAIADAYPADVADQDRRILAALQAVPSDIDLVQTQVGLLGDQVAGFYDDETQQLVVRAEDAGASLGAFGLITLAHELDHALVDATIGLPALDSFGEDEDAAIAALAVVEGSAVATQTQFQSAAISGPDLFADLGALAGAEQGLDGVPAFVADSLTFPYTAGPSYICSAYSRGGWEAVDAALADPPATSHEVMFGGDATTDPVEVVVPTGPDGFERQSTRTFGAAPLSWLLSAPGDDREAALPDPVASVEGWQGGEVTLWTRGSETAVALVLSGADLCEPLAQWWTAATDGPVDAGDEQVVRQGADGMWGVVRCAGDDVRLGVGPTVEIARAAIES